jgi:hypothetical protein
MAKVAKVSSMYLEAQATIHGSTNRDRGQSREWKEDPNNMHPPQCVKMPSEILILNRFLIKK